ncbi:YciI family protein [Actinobacillus arthritidis]|uniref:YciI family protein n=1 Tax=Actinobacillus arthritidis TaxID=157339 RepID=UPI002443079D|nr:YciI family protein [Actinobacillus arthritidis]WGE89613.1 YciI family protein [Actinobacillus arthritidis]
MYIINIAVNNNVTAEQQEKLFAEHVEWFKKYFQAGKFLMLGPFKDQANAGVIFAHTDSRAELDQILAEDCYYPNLASYDIREFEPKLIAANISEFAGK